MKLNRGWIIPSSIIEFLQFAHSSPPISPPTETHQYYYASVTFYHPKSQIYHIFPNHYLETISIHFFQR